MLHPLESRAPKIYKRVCKFIAEIGYSEKISVALSYVTLHSKVAIIYVDINDGVLSVSNICKLLYPYFHTYMNMKNSFRIYIIVQDLRI